jgi:hypothetical protein
MTTFHDLSFWKFYWHVTRILTISILYNILAHSICILELLSPPNVVLDWPIHWGNRTFLMHDALICIHLIVICEVMAETVSADSKDGCLS